MFFSYLRRHYKVILMLAVFAIIFSAVFSLYSLPAEAVWYSVILCVAAGIPLFLIGFISYVKRHRQLEQIKTHICFSVEGLPVPKGALEADYQDMLSILKNELSDAQALRAGDHRDMEEYYAMWAHQIKTPIAAMSLLLQSGGGHDELRAELMHIERYVDMVLSYVRLDNAKDLVIKQYELDPIVRACVRKFARMFILKKLNLTYEPCELTVTTDEKWISFVIEQLLSNAVKYTFAGGVKVSVCDNALIIEDTGIGIREEDIRRVFEKGFTGYNGREDRKSTGIGLYLAKRTCDMLNHTISIDSTLKSGTRVTVGFPKNCGTLE